MPKGFVSDLVSGKRRFNEDVLYGFSSALGLEPADLLRLPDMPRDELDAEISGMSADQRRRALAIIRALKAA